MDVRFAVIYGRTSDIAGGPGSAGFGLMHCSKTTLSFDHRVVESEQCRQRESGHQYRSKMSLHLLSH